MGFLSVLNHLLTQMKLHGTSLAPAWILDSFVLIPCMFVDWLSPKPVCLLAVQRQEALKYGAAFVLGSVL